MFDRESDRHGLPTVENMVEEFIGLSLFADKTSKTAALEEKKAEDGDDVQRADQEGKRI